jgi:hypothetical protein
MLLQEQGKLSVEDDLTRYLPDYLTHGYTITIEHLLTDTSGIFSYTSVPEMDITHEKARRSLEGTILLPTCQCPLRLPSQYLPLGCSPRSDRLGGTGGIRS